MTLPITAPWPCAFWSAVQDEGEQNKRSGPNGNSPTAPLNHSAIQISDEKDIRSSSQSSWSSNVFCIRKNTKNQINSNEEEQQKLLSAYSKEHLETPCVQSLEWRRPSGGWLQVRGPQNNLYHQHVQDAEAFTRRSSYWYSEQEKERSKSLPGQPEIFTIMGRITTPQSAGDVLLVLCN